MHAPLLPKPPLAGVGIARLIKQLNVVDVADDVGEILLGEQRPRKALIPDCVDHPRGVVPEQTSELLKTPARTDEGEVGSQGAAVAPDGVAANAPVIDKDPATGYRIAREEWGGLCAGRRDSGKHNPDERPDQAGGPRQADPRSRDHPEPPPATRAAMSGK